MKKIFFALAMLLTLGGITYAQASPSKANPAPRNEVAKSTTKAQHSTSSVSPGSTAKNTSTANAAPKTSTKPASPGQPVANSDIGKHKKNHHASKKHK